MLPKVYVPPISIIQCPAILPNLLNEWAVKGYGEPANPDEIACMVYVPGGSVPKVRKDAVVP